MNVLVVCSCGWRIPRNANEVRVLTSYLPAIVDHFDTGCQVRVSVAAKEMLQEILRIRKIRSKKYDALHPVDVAACEYLPPPASTPGKHPELRAGVQCSMCNDGPLAICAHCGAGMQKKTPGHRSCLNHPDCDVAEEQGITTHLKQRDSRLPFPHLVEDQTPQRDPSPRDVRIPCRNCGMPTTHKSNTCFVCRKNREDRQREELRSRTMRRNVCDNCGTHFGSLNDDSPAKLCGSCSAASTPFPKQRCKGCATPVESGNDLCNECIQRIRRGGPVPHFVYEPVGVHERRAPMDAGRTYSNYAGNFEIKFDVADREAVNDFFRHVRETLGQTVPPAEPMWMPGAVSPCCDSCTDWLKAQFTATTPAALATCIRCGIQTTGRAARRS